LQGGRRLRNGKGIEHSRGWMAAPCLGAADAFSVQAARMYSG